jgi:hypothetical protein
VVETCPRSRPRGDDRRRRRSLPAAAVGLTGALLATASPAGAQAPTEADTLFTQGRELLEKGQYGEACPKLARSEQLAPAIGTLLNLGYCYEQIGRYRSSMDAYAEAEVLAKSATDAKRAAFAKDRLAAVEAKVTKVVVRVAPGEPPGLEVRRNGTAVPKTDWGQAIPVDPDEIEITASAPGHMPWKGVVLARGDAALVTVFVPLLAERGAGATAAHADSGRIDAPGPRRLAALGLGAGAALSIGAGFALALSAKSRYDDSKSGCDATGCDPAALDVQHRAVTQGNIATALLGLGVLLAGAGAYLWFFASDTAAADARGVGARF